MDVGVVLDQAPAEELVVVALYQLPHVGSGGLRRLHGKRDYHPLLSLLQEDGHVAAPADTAHGGFHHTDGKGSGHGGVYGIAAILQHFQARLGGEAMLGRHHARRRGRCLYVRFPFGLGRHVLLLLLKRGRSK